MDSGSRFALITRPRFGRNSLALTAAVATLLGAPAAHAGSLACTFKISGVSTTPSGTVYVQMDGVGTPIMCNTSANVAVNMGPIAGTITPDTCKAWVSMFITAKTTQQNFTLIFDYGAATAPASCASLPNFSWQVPTVFPYYVSFAG
jgi:hypothetical protein